MDNVFLEMLEDLKRATGTSDIKEIISRSDLPLTLLGGALDRILLKGYNEYPSNVEVLVKPDKVKDFRQAERLMTFGSDGVLDSVRELAEYPYTSRGEGRYTFRVGKFGRKIAFSWEDFINDDLNSLGDQAYRFGRGAKKSEQRFITNLFWDAAGPNAAFFNMQNNNLSNLPLSVTNLATILGNIAQRVDPNTGDPIVVTGWKLEVCPALEIAARNILDAIQIEIPEQTINANQTTKMMVNNWLRSRLSLVVNPWIPIVNQAANNTTCFALYADYNDVAAGNFARLLNHEQPEIWMKKPNAVKIGGGEDPFNGDFDTDAVEYKVRHVFGGTLMDPLGAYASTGQ